MAGGSYSGMRCYDALSDLDGVASHRTQSLASALLLLRVGRPGNRTGARGAFLVPPRRNLASLARCLRSTGDMAVRQRPVEPLLRERLEGLSRWLAEHAPDCQRDQRHLDEGTTERAYWHYGYLVALADVVRLLHEADDQN